jgi:RES domain-containing protein
VTGGNAWPALYTSLDLATALGEIQRNIKLSGLKDYRVTEIWVQLEHVVDCREMPKTNRFLDDVDYSVGQSIAASAISQGAEAILVPSATLLGDNLVIFRMRLETVR